MLCDLTECYKLRNSRDGVLTSVYLCGGSGVTSVLLLSNGV